ncbi:MAG: hypothetical protein WC581_05710 [Thermodesulfovibrionales bacterium]
MPEKKRIYVSDVHMRAGRKPVKKSFDYDWLGAAEAKVFADFLKFLIDDAGRLRAVIDAARNEFIYNYAEVWHSCLDLRQGLQRNHDKQHREVQRRAGDRLRLKNTFERR